jgi:hypothetical protein
VKRPWANFVKNSIKKFVRKAVKSTVGKEEIGTMPDKFYFAVLSNLAVPTPIKAKRKRNRTSG